MNKKHNEKKLKLGKTYKRKMQCFDTLPGTKTRNKNPIGTKKPGNVLLDRMQRRELRGLELETKFIILSLVPPGDCPKGEIAHRQPKLILRAAHKLDCFFHAMHNIDIGTLCIIMTSATFKSLYGSDTKRLKLPQISRNKNDLPHFIVVLVII